MREASGVYPGRSYQNLTQRRSCKNTSNAEKILKADVIGREKRLHLCHILSRMAFEDVLTFCVLMDREVNRDPWAQMERWDKRCAEGRRVVS